MKEAKTAATAHWMIKRVGDRVDLYQIQGDAWIRVQKNIDMYTAECHGFNGNAPAVQEVFEEIGK